MFHRARGIRLRVKVGRRGVFGMVEVQQPDANVEQQSGRDGVVEVDAIGVRTVRSGRDRRQIRRESVCIVRIRFGQGEITGQLHLGIERLVDLDRRDGRVLPLGVGRNGVIIQNTGARPEPSGRTTAGTAQPGPGGDIGTELLGNGVSAPPAVLLFGSNIWP